MDTITCVIHTYNEEGNVKDCIASARLLTNRIIVIDMESRDNTVSIAKASSVPVYTYPFSHYVEPAREFGIHKATTPWVFILDADERMTKELADEIHTKIGSQHAQSYTYFRVPRKNIFGGKTWLKHGGWWPDAQIRCIHTPSFQSWNQRIHSTPVIAGQEGLFNNPIEHFFHGDIENMVAKTTVYEEIEAELLYKAQRDVSVPLFFRKFAGELFRRFFKNQGFLDGPYGIIESIYQAFSKTITYLYLYEKKNRAL